MLTNVPHFPMQQQCRACTEEWVTGGEGGSTAQFHRKVRSESCPWKSLYLRQLRQCLAGGGSQALGSWNPPDPPWALRAGLESPWLSQMPPLFHLRVCSDCRHQRPCGIPASLLHTEGSTAGSSDSYQHKLVVVLSQDVTPQGVCTPTMQSWLQNW